MTGRNDDDAWRAIVENYGDRPELDEPERAPEAQAPPPASLFRMPDLGDDDPEDDLEDRFVPPEPGPLPHPPPVRFAAWTGLFGAPAVLLVCLMLGIELPSLLGYALIAAFLGGFAYLVLHMRRGPREPWDDGAQI